MILPFEGSPGAEAALNQPTDYGSEPTIVPDLRMVDHEEPGPCTAICLDDGIPENTVPPCITYDLQDYLSESSFGIPAGYEVDLTSGRFALPNIDPPAEEATIFKDPEGMNRADNGRGDEFSTPIEGVKAGYPYNPNLGRYIL